MIVWLLVALATVVAQAPEPAGPPRFERAITIAAPGPQRLVIDVPLLAGAAPFSVVRREGPAPRWTAEGGLADLRLFDPTGREVPYILVGSAPDPGWAAARTLPIPSTRKSSGFEADLGTARQVDALNVVGLPAPFLKRFSLEASADRQRWTVLVGDGTLFDLPAQGIRQLVIPFAQSTIRYLRLTWDDTNSARVPLPSGAAVRLVGRAPVQTPLAIPISIEKRPSEPGRSRYRLRLPGPHLPIVSIRLDTPAEHVYRRATVSEARIVNGEAVPSVLGEGTLARERRDGVSADALTIAISPPSEADLDLVIEDGDNAALDLTAASGESAELPWIYFEAQHGPILARFGGAGPQAPSYDLEAVRRTLDISRVPEAHWAEAGRKVAPPAAASADAETSLGGGPLDTSEFRYRRPISSAPAGLVALPLDAAVLAHSLGPVRKFADVRIVDAVGRQVPYLLERQSEPLSVELKAEPATTSLPELQSSPSRHQSVYRIPLPFAGLPESTLVLRTSARVFQRTVSIGVQREPDRRRRDPWFEQLARRNWNHVDDATPAPALGLVLTPGSATEVLLAVEEGDNAPLPIAGVSLLLPAYRLRFFHNTAAELSVVYGRAEATVPRYDLALLAQRVMGAAAADAVLGPEAGGPAPGTAAVLSPRVFWLLLVVTVLILLGVIVRLVRGGAAGQA